MEEIALKPIARIVWNGKNVTGDLQPFLSSVTYTDHEEGAADDVQIVLDNGEGLWSGDWFPAEGDTIQLYMGYENGLMDCGLFQVDEITFSGKPDIVTVKTIASFFTLSLRTKNSKEFEAQTLSQIALYFCKKHGLKLVDQTSNMLSQIFLDRKTQEEKTDLQFLSELASEYGFIFSVKGNQLIFTSFYDLDNADAIKDISSTQIGNYSITEKCFDTYAGGYLAKRNTRKNAVIRSVIKEEFNTMVSDLAQMTGHTENQKQAEQRIKGGLWKKNRSKRSGTLNDIPGDPYLVAGINFNITGLNQISGKYHITTSTHTITGDGAYTTSLDIRKTGEIPKPQRVPAPKYLKPEFDENKSDYNN